MIRKLLLSGLLLFCQQASAMDGETREQSLLWPKLPSCQYRIDCYSEAIVLYRAEKYREKLGKMIFESYIVECRLQRDPENQTMLEARAALANTIKEAVLCIEQSEQEAYKMAHKAGYDLDIPDEFFLRVVRNLKSVCESELKQLEVLMDQRKEEARIAKLKDQEMLQLCPAESCKYDHLEFFKDYISFTEI